MSPVIILSCPTVNGHKSPLSDEYIDQINSIQNVWTAGPYFFRNKYYFERFMGMKKKKSIHLDFSKIKHALSTTLWGPELPVYFDARDHWVHCPTIGEIRDQGSCGSCWAVAAASVMSDRVCIHSNGSDQFYFSSQNVISCCEDCGFGCFGGNVPKAWDYWITTGIVSGGPYNSHRGCVPYEIPPCEHYVTGNRIDCHRRKIVTPKCVKKCQEGYHKPYEEDLKRGTVVYRVRNNVQAIQREIYNNGPVQAIMIMYEDFLTYKSGVYKHVYGKELNSHAVRILGWGIQNNTSYWLAANTWNTDWGDSGFFKILKGSDECYIESLIFAGLP